MNQTFTLGLTGTCPVDLGVLADTRLLVQANSGAGKSWCLRRLLEQTHGRIQHLIIDPEGEFLSLRERFDYVLAARSGGDTVADPRSAKLLAERLLELNVSAILDIYELKAHERIRFVRAFLEALVDAPKKLWHPALVVVDEAHVYAPQVGEAESAGAVIDLATRGRKRGFCAVLATQRLSKLHKDAAAECNNKLIGRTGLDVDMKRAGDELGFTKDQLHGLRELEAGHFFAFGPAISRTVMPIQVGLVMTTHPKAGGRLVYTAPPPTAKVRALLPQLADLPQEAEAKQKTEQELRTEITSLKRELTIARKAQPVVPKPERVEVPIITEKQEARLVAEFKGFRQYIDPLITHADMLLSAVEDLRHSVAAAMQPARPIFPAVRRTPERVRPGKASPAEEIVARMRSVRDAVRQSGKASPAKDTGRDDSTLVPAQQRILNGLAFLAGIGVPSADKTQLALIVGVSPTSGGYFNNLGSMRSQGLIFYPSGGTVALTSAGERLASAEGVPQTTDELHAAIRAKLPLAKWKIVERLIEVYPADLEKNILAEDIGVSPTSGGFFNNLGSLRSLGLIDYPRPGCVVAKPVLFLE